MGCQQQLPSTRSGNGFAVKASRLPKDDGPVELGGLSFAPPEHHAAMVQRVRVDELAIGGKPDVVPIVHFRVKVGQCSSDRDRAASERLAERSNGMTVLITGATRRPADLVRGDIP